jgi:plastocyanin
VTVRNNLSFNPENIQVSPGATVTWTWEGTTSEAHNVTFTNPAIANSPNQTSGTHQATMPTAAGTYDYRCTNHGGMDGTVLVQ